MPIIIILISNHNFVDFLDFGAIAGDSVLPNISSSLFDPEIVINLPVPIVFYGWNRTVLNVSNMSWIRIQIKYSPLQPYRSIYRYFTTCEKLAGPFECQQVLCKWKYPHQLIIHKYEHSTYARREKLMGNVVSLIMYQFIPFRSLLMESYHFYQGS